jgi:hypothetical protein
MIDVNENNDTARMTLTAKALALAGGRAFLTVSDDLTGIS